VARRHRPATRTPSHSKPLSGDSDAASIPRGPVCDATARASCPRAGGGHGVQGWYDFSHVRTRRLQRSRWRGCEGDEEERQCGEGREEGRGNRQESRNEGREGRAAHRDGAGDDARPHAGGEAGACPDASCGYATRRVDDACPAGADPDDACSAGADPGRRDAARTGGRVVRRPCQQHRPHRCHGAVQGRNVLARDEPSRCVREASRRREMAVSRTRSVAS